MRKMAPVAIEMVMRMGMREPVNIVKLIGLEELRGKVAIC
jgi:hypothetical protein